MPRRYMTLEDVQRAGGPEIIVDEETTVTPQALEFAEGAGITIRTSAGAYSAPHPDRGPDAELAMRELPHLPEPRDSVDGQPHETGAIVTAVGRNRPGVLAEITVALAELGANVLDVSQKMIGGYFHLIVTVDFAQGRSFEEAKAKLSCLGGEGDYVVRVMHERVFRFMHRV